MKNSYIKLILWPIIILLVYFVYNSIQSEISFQEDAKKRISENVQKLKDLRALQIAHKKVNGFYASNFDDLIHFLNNGLIPIIKAEGETPDSLINGQQITDVQALEMGLISRDTSFAPVKDIIFDNTYLQTRDENYPLDINSLTKIPHTNGIDYNIDAGVVEKGKVMVQVFEISAEYRKVLVNLDAENKKYDLNNLLKVGSMEEASLNGNWGE